MADQPPQAPWAKKQQGFGLSKWRLSYCLSQRDMPIMTVAFLQLGVCGHCSERHELSG